MDRKPFRQRHPDDDGIDEVFFVPRLCQTYEEVQAVAFLRIGIVERYKTSGLSGGEWRFSTMLQVRESVALPWVDTSNGYSRLRHHCAALYPELYGDLQVGKNRWMVERHVGAIAFSWKGIPVWSSSYDGEPVTLLVACGHLPWALTKAGEDGAHSNEALTRLCCQPGCREPLVTVYRKKLDYCSSCAHGRDPERIFKEGMSRGYCCKHLRRGDCGWDDSDSNYEVLSGHGPAGREPDRRKVSESILGGIVTIDEASRG